MTTHQAVIPWSQIMRREFEHSLCLRKDLKYRRLHLPTPLTCQRPPNGTGFVIGKSSFVSRTLSTTSPCAFPTWREKNLRHQLGKPRLQRVFSVSARPHAAIAIANPRQDEDGNEMLVDITDRASTRLKEIMAKDNNPSLALRVTVESGGCHGFQYLMSLTNMSAISADDDTVFEASNGSGARVVMDEPSLELLKGSKVDFTMELIGSQFKIVGNPAATSSCGCGTSFDIKL
ncbi:MAG: hypothetical protein L6R37_001629 [Teloschistes peruensis]|nr:MAG: hypothetical protein L6R37_001629 [Teloschistes peruensis]